MSRFTTAVVYQFQPELGVYGAVAEIPLWQPTASREEALLYAMEMTQNPDGDRQWQDSSRVQLFSEGMTARETAPGDVLMLTDEEGNNQVVQMTHWGRFQEMEIDLAHGLDINLENGRDIDLTQEHF